MDEHEHQEDKSDIISHGWPWADDDELGVEFPINGEGSIGPNVITPECIVENPYPGYAGPWWMAPTTILPWWMRRDWGDGYLQGLDWTGSSVQRGWWNNHWFVDSYPVLGPYYVTPSMDPAFIDPWTMQSYPGPWWP